jgi:hypothetical protein
MSVPGDVHKTCRRILRRHGWIERDSEYGTVAEEVGERRGRSLSITAWALEFGRANVSPKYFSTRHARHGFHTLQTCFFKMKKY